MATPTLGNVPTTIDDAESATGWSTLTTLDTDLVKEGSNSVSGIFRVDLTTGYYDIITDGGSAINLTGQHVRVWINFSTVAFLDVEANGGMEFYMYDGSTTEYKVAFGSDTYAGGWKNFVIDCDTFTTLTLSSIQRWGFRFNRIAAPANKINTWVDYIRYGNGYYATGGTSGDEIDVPGIFALDFAAGYGIIDRTEGIYFVFGELQIGNGSTTTWFEMIGEVLVFTDSPVAAGLYQIRGEGSGCRVNIESSVIRASGTGDDNRFIIDMDDADIVSCNISSTFITRAGESRFKSGQTITANTFSNCGQILAGGADLDGTIVSGYEGTADESALVWTPATDPNGLLDNMQFTKGTASTHAIEFGTASPLTMTLTGIDFSGYNASDAQTDSTFLVRRTSGTVTINLDNCTGNVSYKSLGATVVVQASVQLTIKVIDRNKDPIENAQTSIFLEASPFTELMNEDTTALGIATESYAYPGSETGVVVKVRKSATTDDPRYQAFSDTQTVTANGLTLTVTLDEVTVPI